MNHDEGGAQLLGGSPHPQVEGAHLLLEVGAPQQDGAGALQVGDPGTGGDCRQELGSEPVIELGVEVVGAHHRPQELAEGVGILVGAASASQAGDGVASVLVDHRTEALRHQVERLSP